MVREMTNTVGCMIGEDIRLDNRLEDAPAMVKLDPDHFRQALMNLVVNARDAMPKGGSLVIETVNVEMDEKFVREHAGSVPGSYVRVTVSDTGAGMDEETIQRIFEPFYTTKPKGRGTGLGLPMVFGFVKQSRGYLDVTSQPESGSRFSMYFPRVDGGRPETADSGDTQIESLPVGQGTILVVEDDQQVREMVTEGLRESGYAVLDAADADEALSIGVHSEKRIDLLMTDVVMPGMDGLELSQEIQTSRPGIETLFVSGYAGDTLEGHGLEPDRIDILMKPFSIKELTAAIACMLGRASRGRRTADPRSRDIDRITGDEDTELDDMTVPV